MAPPSPALFLSSDLLRAHGVPHAFSLRDGGVSAPPFESLNLGGSVGDDPAAVEENHRRLASAAGLDRARLATAKQVHGDRVIHAVPSAEAFELRDARAGEALPKDPEADAVVALAGVAVGVRTADCVPILLYDPITGAAGAVHAGWRGTVARLAVKAIGVLVRDYGARAPSIRAAIGPAIGRCCFDVGDDLAERFATDPAFGARTVEPRRGDAGARVDLFLANRLLLESAGLKPDHVDVLAHCTSCEPARFFSHRRDAGRTGRHLSLIRAGRS